MQTDRDRLPFRALNWYMDWIVAFPMTVTKFSKIGCILHVPWMILLALFGPFTLGTFVIILFWCLIDDIYVRLSVR